jgi:hypothetical protein
MLTSLGLEYYNTAHYSLALDAWEKLGRWRRMRLTGKAKPSPTAQRANWLSCTRGWDE